MASEPPGNSRTAISEVNREVDSDAVRKASTKAASRRKLVKWLLLCAGLSVVPIGFDALVQLFSGRLHPFNLISNGSIYLIAFAMSAAAHGDFRFDRVQTGRADYTHLRHTYLCGGVTLASALLYALNKASEGNGTTNQNLVVVTSAVVWLAALIVGWQAVSASEQSGKEAADVGGR
jgi:hypothetical protein